MMIMMTVLLNTQWDGLCDDRFYDCGDQLQQGPHRVNKGCTDERSRDERPLGQKATRAGFVLDFARP